MSLRKTVIPVSKKVTELIGGGFILGFQACHSIVDGFGMIQFIKSIGDLARGEVQPAVLPVWERHILMARTPPRITDIDPAYTQVLTGSEYDANRIVNDVMLSTTVESMVHKYLIFSPREITHLRGYIVPSLLTKPATAFELLTAVMWRCRTIALGYEVDTKVRLIFTINARGRWKRDFPIPRGYYGNAFVYTIVEIAVGDLCGKPLGHIVELIRKAKTDMSLERMRSMVDMMALLRRRPTLPARQVYWVSDNSHIGGDTVDFGWAEWVGADMPVPKLSSFHTRCKDVHGEESIIVSVLLPGSVMDKFTSEIASWLNKDNGGNYFTPSSL
ncbi:acyl transferase 1-like [Triticum dicoccoides]|uniref:acyl transferase 1-like n=1 Tax=Triticum dicoccoides TaxID=85692 RepID=UPI001891388D|nr:acyl transferase 1-like [Triticum dicoccoides]